MKRRELLMSAGAGAAALSGCLNGEGDDIRDGEPEFDLVDSEPDYRGYFDGVDSYRDVGGTVDWTGEDEVTVQVGTRAQTNQYRPPAVAVDAGTTVEWEWETRGHNVVRAREARRSTAASRAEDVDTGEEDWTGEDRITNPPHSYSHTFTEPGIYLYVCSPHDSQRMYGAVAVDEV